VICQTGSDQSAEDRSGSNTSKRDDG